MVKFLNMEYNTSNYMRTAYERYRYSPLRCELKDIYKKPSYAKEVAYKKCRKLFDLLDGYNFKFIGNNTFNFSCGFVCVANGEEYFVYITHAHTRYMAL